MPESSHRLVAENAERLKEILQAVSVGGEPADDSGARALDRADDRSGQGTFSAWTN